MAIERISRRARRRAKLGLHASAVMVAALTLVGCNLSTGVDTAAADPGPKRLVGLPDGRKLNLACAGHGSPTVLLEAGFGADAQAWFKVQPALAKKTRVCAYDRAGYGYSDPAPAPRDGAAIARDLDQALTAAGIGGPFVVVGHSAGGLYARLFAARRAKDMAGLVLLDPTIERHAPQPSGDGLDGLRQRVRRCLAASEAAPPPPIADPRWSGCVPGNPSPHQIEVSKRPGTWTDQLSELDTLFGRTSEQAAMTLPLLQSIPLYVITASRTADAAPAYGFDPPRSAWELLHQRLASNSEFGSQRTVFSSHMIMLDRPEIVVAAAEEMIAAQRAGHPPDPLPPAEKDFSPDGVSPTPTAPPAEAALQGVVERLR